MTTVDTQHPVAVHSYRIAIACPLAKWRTCTPFDRSCASVASGTSPFTCFRHDCAVAAASGHGQVTARWEQLPVLTLLCTVRAAHRSRGLFTRSTTRRWCTSSTARCSNPARPLARAAGSPRSSASASTSPSSAPTLFLLATTPVSNFLLLASSTTPVMVNNGDGGEHVWMQRSRRWGGGAC
jgi:hypothetical protein